MIVIAHPTPLHYLLLNHIEILKEPYGRVIIPWAVWRELRARKTPAPIMHWISRPPSWLELRNVSVPNDPALMELDAGGVRP